MKRTLTILFAILAAITVTGVFVQLAKSGPIPANVRDLDWRRIVKSRIADPVGAIAEELPA
ncbi:MAG TPA: hypothetical protein VE011_04290 [Candidatus Dormibacteraeota bacterium]|nr:hypothetical protein [Candidatus Dormibacteraeota bacterium]